MLIKLILFIISCFTQGIHAVCLHTYFASCHSHIISNVLNGHENLKALLNMNLKAKTIITINTEHVLLCRSI